MLQVTDYLKPLQDFYLPGLEILTWSAYVQKYGTEPPSNPNKPYKSWRDTRPAVVSKTSRTVIYETALVIGENGTPILGANGIYEVDNLGLPREDAISFNLSPEKFAGGVVAANSYPIPLQLPADADVVNAPGLPGVEVVRLNKVYQQYLAEQRGGSIDPSTLAGILATLTALDGRTKTALDLLNAIALKLGTS